VGPTGADRRVLQIHPTRRCNLRCLHCYSSSGPGERGELDPVLLSQLLTDASREGYTIAGFSGGEPLLYRPLPELLAHARACQMRTTVTTNGMLLTERHLGRLRSCVDVLAISVDGVPTSHDRMRARVGAFDKLARRLGAVRASGIRFGFIFTLTQSNLNELEWVAAFAVAEGAQLLQIHPLEGVGRASRTLRGHEPDRIEQTWAHLAAAGLQEAVGSRLHIQLDIVDLRLLATFPERVFAGDSLPDESAPLAEEVSPLVVEPDGTIVPLQYGFPREFAIGNINDAPLTVLQETWRHDRLSAFRDLARSVHQSLIHRQSLPFENWYAAMRSAARRLADLDVEKPTSMFGDRLVPQTRDEERSDEGLFSPAAAL
jgi:MoaA/NifB/PqqE/SkfB family radical SAM enzyme